ncbi:MAG: hypothetical protein U0L67_08550 [Paludibacteraceae bacterium]|jgi:hypothetical protein|nr:hypothetical protein [Paludibacteraceae bacterium]MEE0912484.1 hypothetical protein [Paludibacteraceae bacterium]
MRKLIFVMMIICVLTTQMSAKENSFSNERVYALSQLELPFIAKELVDSYELDSTYLQKWFLSDSLRNVAKFKLDEEGDWYPMDVYVNDVCAMTLIDSLEKYRTLDNAERIDNLIKSIRYQKPNLGDLNFCEDVFETGLSSDFFANFVILYMSEKELLEMSRCAMGKSLQYVLEDISYGEYLKGDKTFSNNITKEVNLRISDYLINKWSSCQSKTSKALLSALLSAKKYLNFEPSNSDTLMTGLWIGKHYDKTVEAVIKAENGDGLLVFEVGNRGKSIFSSKYIDDGMYIIANLKNSPQSPNEDCYVFKVSKNSELTIRYGNSSIFLKKYSCSSNLYSAEIIDPDGYVNLREDSNSKSKVLAKIPTGAKVLIEPVENSNWYVIHRYQIGEQAPIYCFGYIYRDRCKNKKYYFDK